MCCNQNCFWLHLAIRDRSSLTDHGYSKKNLNQAFIFLYKIKNFTV